MIDEQRFAGGIKSIIKAERNATLNDQASKATIDSGYASAGGPPKVVEAGATGSYEHSVVSSYFWGFPTASEGTVKQPIGDSDVLMGKIYDIPTGVIYNVGAYKLLPKEYPEANTTVVNTTTTAVRGNKFEFAVPLLVAKVSFEVVSATASALAAIGIYSSDRSHLLIDTGAIDCSSNGVKEITLGSPVYLPPGFYWVMFTLNDTSTTLRAVAMASNMNVLNQGTVQRGLAANGATAAVLPSTLGTVSSASFNAPIVKLQA